MAFDELSTKGSEQPTFKELVCDFNMEFVTKNTTVTSL